MEAIDTLKAIFRGVWNLLVGLKTTAKYLPRRAVTLQYPDERWPMPERSRGVVVLLSDPDTGELNCNACLVCMKQCPVSAIDITQGKNEDGKRYPVTFTIDNTLCCFCGICEEVCNFDSIKLTGKYEFSVFNKADLVYDRDKLQELGRDVKYERKRKPRPAAKLAAKPAESSEIKKEAASAPEIKSDSDAEEKV
jgi:NADH-quinone oxidoreductase subunit I